MADDVIADLRIDPRDEALRREHLPAEPMPLLREWLSQAFAAGVRDANAMSLATCDADGQPHCRMVLMKRAMECDLGFYTNKLSAKGEQLRANARAAVTFWWVAPRARQVRIEGVIRELPEADAQAYFASRPRRAQLCSAASPQSQVIKNRAQLERLVDEFAERVGDSDVPRPAHWGGYALEPARFEFWQGREARLHDRFGFTRVASAWRVDRLAP